MAHEIKITLESGDSWITRLDPGQRVIIGREASVRIPDPRVAPRHCALTASEHGGCIIDLGSSSGTFLNGRRIASASVGRGDTIRVGTTRIEVDAPSPGSGETDRDGPDRDGNGSPARTDAADGSSSSTRSGPSGAALQGFDLKRRLGTGSVGRVYHAVEREKDREVAVKVFRRDAGLSERVARRFVQEARISLDLEHPGIVETHDLVLADDVFYLVMEYVDGIDLRRLMEMRGRIRPLHALGIVARVARGLEYAHDRRIVHRDVKPSNILISRDREVKLTDFGLAKSLEQVGVSELTRAGELVGTPYYMSPEQLLDARRVDRRSDIYSLGVTLYHAITGRVPYRAGSVEELIDRVWSTDPEPVHARVEDLPPEVSRVVKKAMAREQAHRYPTMEAFVEELKASARRL